MQAKKLMVQQLHRWLSASMITLLGICTVQASEPIIAEPDNNLRPAQVRAQPDAYHGLQIHWSGRIAAVENRGQETVLLIGDETVDDDSQAQADTSRQGLFMAKINRILNPTVYTGRFVTVAGTVMGSETRVIDNDPDSYPFIAVDNYHLSFGSQQQQQQKKKKKTTASYRYHSCRDSSSPYPWTQFGYAHLFNQCSP